MLKSNQPSVPLSMHQGRSSLNDSISRNVSTLDNIKVREQIRSVQKARARGDSTAAAQNATRLRLQESVAKAAVRPLVRKTTARDYANE